MWIISSNILIYFLLVLSAGCAQNHGHDHDHSRCATSEPDEEHIKKDRERMGKYRSRRRSLSEIRSICVGCVTIDLIFHVLEDGGRQSNAIAFLTTKNIAEQVDVLNEHFADTPFRFRHRQTVRTSNDNWAFQPTFGQQDFAATIVSALRKGGADVANLFFTDGTCLETGGFATLPVERGMFPAGTYSKHDSIFICSRDISAGFNRRATIVTHEMGHWLGLYHTFRGDSCSNNNNNDFIDDTPQQASFTVGCPVGRDSCPDQVGLDPSQNYMDYTDPICQSEFSPGQMERMFSQVNEYRRQVEPCGPNESDIHIELRYDSEPDTFDVGYVVWDSQDGLRTSLKPSDDGHIDLANKLVSRDMCVPKYVLHEIFIEDSRRIGLQTPGYYTISINDRTLATGSTFQGRKKSVFISGDSVDCSAGFARFAVDISFDKFPWHIFWEVRDATDKLVVDSSATYVRGNSEYSINHIESLLSLERCLPKGVYTFVIRDDSGNGILSPGFFAVSLNGNVVLKGGGNSGFKQSESKAFTIGEGGIVLAPPATVFCFPASSTAEVEGGGPVRMDKLRIGDLIGVGNGEFEPIYGFGHHNAQSLGKFLQLKTIDTILNVSADHMVFVQGRGPIPACLVAVGDNLLGGPGVKLTVDSIKPIVAKGMFAPFTPSGTLIVNGVLTSSFVAFESSSSLKLLGVEFSYHWLARSFEFPHRLICYHIGKCPKEKYDAEGISHWVAAPLRLVQMLLRYPGFAQHFLLVLILMVLWLFNLVEFLLYNPFVLAAIYQTFRFLRCQCGKQR